MHECKCTISIFIPTLWSKMLHVGSQILGQPKRIDILRPWPSHKSTSGGAPYYNRGHVYVPRHAGLGSQTESKSSGCSTGFCPHVTPHLSARTTAYIMQREMLGSSNIRCARFLTGKSNGVLLKPPQQNRSIGAGRPGYIF
jgi:hypothetical protein